MEQKKDTYLKFYEVSKEYLDYLRKFETKIPNIEYANREKFVAGILFKINDMNYIAPVSSFNKSQHTNFVLKIEDYPVGSIRFSFMMPVPSSELRRKDFTADSAGYKHFVKQELRLCNENRLAIRNKALDVYYSRTKNIPMYKQVCCDFKALESRCHEWMILKSKEKETMADTKRTIVENNFLSLDDRLNKAFEKQNTKKQVNKKSNYTKER